MQIIAPPTEILAGALRACKRHFVAVASFSALLNLLFIVPMLYMLQVYDRVVPTQGGTTLLFLTLVLVFGLATLSILDAVRARLLVRASVRLDRVLSHAVLDATLIRPGTGAQRLSKQVLREFDIFRQALSGPAILGVFDAPWSPIYVLIAFLIHPWMGVLATIGALVLLFITWRNEQATREPLQQANEAAGRAYAGYEFTAASSDVVRALGIREALISGHLRDRHEMLRLQTEASLASSGLTATSKFVRLALQSLALGLGALLAIQAKISPGAIFASMFIVGRALAPIDQLVGSWKNIVQARDAYRKLCDLFAETPANIALTLLPRPEGRLEAENVTVLDPSRRPILANISFRIEPGEVIAIVGPSGAGKSTLVRALAGAVIPDGGLVRFDGADQRNWDSERLAEHIGFMPQEAALFAGTVKENISRFRSRLGEAAASIDEATVEAAQLAGAHDLILRLPSGYDYPLGLGGRGLSAGQAQRIALARAVFRSPQYVILDEPNSALDAEGDQQLTKTLEALKQRGVTVLIVAHRLSVLPVVEKLMVIREGRLVMFGPRDDILRELAPPPPARVGTRGRIEP